MRLSEGRFNVWTHDGSEEKPENGDGRLKGEATGCTGDSILGSRHEWSIHPIMDAQPTHTSTLCSMQQNPLREAVAPYPSLWTFAN